MAQIAERLGDRSALEWWSKVAQLEPHSTEDILAWARCALQFNDVGTAERLLKQIEEPGKQTAGYHAVAALVAQALHADEKAVAEWRDAVRLSPNDKNYQLQFGIAQLRAHDAATHEAGEKILRSLREDPAQRAPATRALLTEGINRHENARNLLELGRSLQSYPEATLADRLIYLDFLHQLQDAQFTSYLSDLEKRTSTRSIDLATLLAWMSRNNLNLLALDFIKSVPGDVANKWPVPAALADIYVRLKDWHKLEATIKSANWREFDFLRHAYLARTLREQDKTVGREQEWAAAVKGAAGRSESTMMLMRTVAEWHWESEMVDLLWAVSKQPEMQNEAFLTLYRHYSNMGDTQGLFKVLTRLFELDPTNVKVQNNLAQVSLLLNVNNDEARRLAADAYHRVPSNAAYATTYAYSLMTKGNTGGALQILNSLTDAQLHEPAISAYYGICLAAAKDERARPFLQNAHTATLLPEEKELLAKAENSLN
jgi:thioredoxin-like negative regulator of GroEL